MSSIVLSNNTNSHIEFDDVMYRVKKLRETIQHMSDIEILLFIPDESDEFKKAYTKAILILMTDRRNTIWNKVTLDSWLFFQILVMMDGIFWKECTILEYYQESYQIEWLMGGLCELNPYAVVYAERCCHYQDGKQVMTPWARNLYYIYENFRTK